jgi:hypothetical protein
MLEQLRADGWAEYTGAEFEVIDEAFNGLVLVLQQIVETLKSEHNETFSLFFHGPSDPFLSQKIRKLKHAKLGELEIFLVPVARDKDGYQYEAVFNLIF